jgi:hypothetical protein
MYWACSAGEMPLTGSGGLVSYPYSVDHTGSVRFFASPPTCRLPNFAYLSRSETSFEMLPIV